MRWFVPAFAGDFRLEAAGETSQLIVEKPTQAEREMLAQFLKKARAKDWTSERAVSGDKASIALEASVAEAGKLLVKTVQPKRTSLTAVRFKNGVVEVANSGESKALDALTAKASDESDAVSVRRHTPSCPACFKQDANPRASECLLAFLDSSQHEQWAKHRAIVVTGNLSGERYLLAHRHSARAAAQGRICKELSTGRILHFHDSLLPPEEEVLGAKLILEHRENWLRNEATYFGPGLRFKNPFGDSQDGVADSAFMAGLGRGFSAGLSALRGPQGSVPSGGQQ